MLKDILNKSVYFSEVPSHNKLAVFAGQNFDDFIIEETNELKHLTETFCRKRFLHSVAHVNALYETIYLQKGCSLRYRIQTILRQLSESGHIHYWQKRKHVSLHPKQLIYANVNFDSIRVLVCYFCGKLLFALFFFAAEMGTHELIDMWKLHEPVGTGSNT